MAKNELTNVLTLDKCEGDGQSKLTGVQFKTRLFKIQILTLTELKLAWLFQEMVTHPKGIWPHKLLYNPLLQGSGSRFIMFIRGHDRHVPPGQQIGVFFLFLVQKNSAKKMFFNILLAGFICLKCSLKIMQP